MSDRVIYSEKLTVKQLIQGNEQSFRKLFDTYRNDLYRFSLSMVVSEVHAEEIVQEVFLKLWINRATLNPELSIKSYLFTITRNTTISFLKKAANNSKLREEIFYKSQKLANTTENYLREIELNSILQDALNRLPPRRRLIFEMSRNEGKSYREISKDLNISQNTVRNQLSMALETLRGYLLKNTEVAIILLLFSFGWM